MDTLLDPNQNKNKEITDGQKKDDGFKTLDMQTLSKKVFGPQKYTIQTPNLRRYDWMSRKM